MLSYLQKFNELPKEIKDVISSAPIASRIVEIGEQYKLDLATTVIKIMVKEIPLVGLSAYFVNQHNLSLDQARLLERDLRKYVFNNLIDYLLGPNTGPKLVFSEEDEKEVKQQAQPVQTVDFDKAIDEAVVRVFEKARIKLVDPLTNIKFRQVIKTYLRLTRDRITTMEALTKASELGGIALSRDGAERALAWADIEINELKKINLPPQAKIAVPEDKTTVVTKAGTSQPLSRVTQEVEYDLASSLRASGKLEPPAPKIIEADHELAPPVPAIIKDVPSAPKASVKTISITTPATPEAKKIIKQALTTDQPLAKPDLRRLANETKASEPIVNLKMSSSGKIKMDDIHFTPKVLSPVDELRYMTLKNFRRLNTDPIKATDSIKEKLEYLGRSDYAKKIQGIVAWQESPLNKLYLSICRRALNEGRSVTDVLQAELINEPNSLKPAELSAIIALNHVLKF